MIKLKSLLKEEAPHQIPWRDLPPLEHILNMVKKLMDEQNIDVSMLNGKEYRNVVEQCIKNIYPYQTLHFNSFDGYNKVVQRIADEWFIRKYIISKSNVDNEKFPLTNLDIEKYTGIRPGLIYKDIFSLVTSQKNKNPNTTKREYIELIKSFLASKHD